VNAVVFLVLAAFTIVAAATVVLHRNPVYSALALVGTLFLLAVMFVALDAQLLGILQMIVYAGAIVVLFLFVIMLLNLQAEARALGARPMLAAAAAGGLALVVQIVPGLLRAKAPAAVPVPPGFGETAALGEVLFGDYLLPFELTSVLLLVAVVGAVVLAQRKR
jgi:NADH-quinone oxidoreductase subunit J